MLSYERGPFDLFVRLRSLLGFGHDSDGRPQQWPDTTLARLVACPWCLAVWIAPVVWLVWEVEPVAVVVIAAMAVAVAVERWNNR